MAGQDEKEIKFDWPLNGRLIAKLDGTLLPEAHFQELENLCYNDGGIEGIPGGMSKINASAFSYTKVVNGFQFKKDAPVAESHAFVQTSDGTNSVILKSDNTTSVPSQDTFTSFITLPSNNACYFSEAPDQSMIICDGYTNYVYSGSEYRCAQFINFDPAGSFYYDFTTQVVNTINDSSNRATLKRVAGGLDANAKAVWHFTNGLTDSSGNSHTLTGTGTPTYSTGVFGDATGCITLNGTTQYASIATHADFDHSGGTWSFDGRFRVHTLAATNPIYYQKTDVKKFSFDTGTTEPAAGTTYYGETSGAVIKVLNIVLSGGAWDGSGTGDIYYQITSGNVQNGEHIHAEAAGAGALICNTTSAETDAGDNYVLLSVSSAGVLSFTVYESYAVPAAVVSISTPASTITANTWYFFELVESGNSWYLFVGTTGGTAILQSTVSDSSRTGTYLSSIYFGYDTSNYFDGDFDEFRFSDTARNIINFLVPLTAYSSAYVTYCYVGSTRPLSGIKFYIGTGNDTAATSEIFEWTGSAWSSVSSLVDGTLDAGATKTMNQTGTMTFTSTVSTSKVKAVNNNVCYYYLCVFSGIDADITVYTVTLEAPVQALLDIWDGVPRQIYSLLYYTTVYSDVTQNVYAINYEASTTTTYAQVGSMSSSYYLYAGFNERCLGIKVTFGSTSVNTNSVVLGIDYWNGTAWTSVGDIDDGTCGFNKTGMITWNSPAISSEFPYSVGNTAQWYYYRIRTSATFSSDVRIDNISGVPAQVTIRPYRYPLLWQNRLWLLDDTTYMRNTAVGSSYGTVCVFNGDDSGYLTFGGSQAVNSGKPLYTRYGGSIYENLVVCKNNETYLVDGNGFTGDTTTGTVAYVVYKIAPNTGCIAPLTMQSCDTGYEIAPGLTKHTLMWLSAAGFEMFDANSMLLTSIDIGDRFDPNDTNYINTSIANKFAAFYDSHHNRYHGLIATGSNTTPNEEWSYDLLRKKWFKVNRSTKYLWCGFEVEDSTGNKYVFGGTGDGYLERLNYGTSFDGVGIAYKFKLADNLLDRSWYSRKRLRSVRLVGKCKTTTSQTVTMNCYLDGNATAATPTTTVISQNVSGKRFFKTYRSLNFVGVTHSIEFTVTTTDENSGFDPLFVTGSYSVIDADRGD